MYKANEKFQLKLPSVFIFRHFCPSNVLVEVRGRFFSISLPGVGLSLSKEQGRQGRPIDFVPGLCIQKKKVENVQFLS